MEFYTIKNQKEILVLALLCFLLQATLIVSDVLTYKITSILSIAFTMPALLYPLTYAIGDTLTEAYGRKITLIILSMAIFIEGLFDLIIYYSATVHDVYDQKYHLAFSYSLGKMHIAALGVVVGTILGFSANTITMYFLKTKFSYRSFPVRSIFSSLTGEVVFTISAFSIWFYSDASLQWKEVMNLVIVSSSFKVFFAILYSLPAYWVAQKLIKNSLSPAEALRITNVEIISDKPGNSLFEFQIIGKRTSFLLRSKQVSLNVYSALSKVDQKLVACDMKGKITHQLDEWIKTKYENQKCFNSGRNKWDWARDSNSSLA